MYEIESILLNHGVFLSLNPLAYAPEPPSPPHS